MQYTPPRTPAFQWLVGSPGADDPAKQSWLIANMFTRTASLVGAAVSEAIIAVTAVHLHRDPILVGWLAAIAVVLIWRLGILARARRAAALGRSTPTGLLAASSVVWAAVLGSGAMLCDLTGDSTLQLLSNVCVFSMIAGLSARNASTPRLAAVQIITVTALCCVGAALAPQVWLKVELAQAPLYCGGLISLCRRANRDLVSMLDVQGKNASLARRDVLTGLPNRMQANEELQALLAASRPDGRFALIWVDMDGFKAVNDTLGHACGDAVLVETGRRLEGVCAALPASVARLGGDEFLVIVPSADRARAAAAAAAIGAAIKAPYALPNAPDVRLGASIGIALHPEHGDRADALLVAADKALYAVKASGRAHWQVYEPRQHAGEDDMILLRSELERALAAGDDQLQLLYQPVIRVADGGVSGREALVRWRHPVRGLVSPAAFVPMAEASGLIIPLGEWVLQRACADAVRWRDPVKVAVNVSPVQLRNEHLAAAVARALARSGLPPERLEIEVTETVLLSGDETTARNMQRLRGLGVDVVLDDFGTGFSSLSNLCRFVFDRIKIDGSFVREALTRNDCAAVIRATVGLARELGVPTTAECIETEEQLAFVQACGCTEVQGYLLGRPAAAASIADDPVPAPSAGLLPAA